MKKYILGVVDIHDGQNYYLSAGESRIIIPIAKMHRMCNFSGLTDSSNLIKNGVQLHLVAIETPEGTNYYPNHRFYLSNNVVVRDHRTLHEDNRSGAPRGQQSMGVESEYLEFKESFASIVKIKETIVAFANSGHEGKIIIGVNDSGIPQGLQDLQDIHARKRLADDLKNQLKLMTSSLDFSQTLVFEWNDIDGKTMCTIHVPCWTGGILLAHGNQLFCRKGSTNQQLKGDDMVNFIVTKYRQSA